MMTTAIEKLPMVRLLKTRPFKVGYTGTSLSVNLHRNTRLTPGDLVYEWSDGAGNVLLSKEGCQNPPRPWVLINDKPYRVTRSGARTVTINEMCGLRTGDYVQQHIDAKGRILLLKRLEVAFEKKS